MTQSASFCVPASGREFDLKQQHSAERPPSPGKGGKRQNQRTKNGTGDGLARPAVSHQNGEALFAVVVRKKDTVRAVRDLNRRAQVSDGAFQPRPEGSCPLRLGAERGA
jgi:hypothetical protein